MNWVEKARHGARVEEEEMEEEGEVNENHGDDNDDEGPDNSYSHLISPDDLPAPERVVLKVNIETINDRLRQDSRTFRPKDAHPPTKNPTIQDVPPTTPRRPISAPHILSDAEANAIRLHLARKRLQRLPQTPANGTSTDTAYPLARSSSRASSAESLKLMIEPRMEAQRKPAMQIMQGFVGKKLQKMGREGGLQRSLVISRFRPKFGKVFPGSGAGMFD
ncbi:hypothetical protein BC829DRAFT_393905 [Chytridium lagenaria]|nr:hypothetical protein BC829DRAFT_393905 [Chytridium lagenaria]